jgi:uncharacterized protein (TIRG00374 family)
MSKTTEIETQSGKTLKSRVIMILKLAFVCGLLYFLAKKGFISVQAMQQAFQRWDKIIPAVLALLFSVGLGVIRWQWLLEAHNIQLGWVKTLQLTFIGNFFNVALPGAVSGDLIKAFYIGKELKAQKAAAFGSILFDRVVGLSALILLSAGALLFNIGSPANSGLIRGIQFVLTAGASGFLAFYTYLFLVREKHDPLLKVLKWMETKVSKLSAITQIYSSLRHYHNHRITILKALGISVIIHMIVGWSCLNFAQALGETHLAIGSLYVVIPLGLLVTAIPVAPAGVGTGNIAFLYLFHLINSERGADIFSLFALTNLFVGALGGLVYFRFRSDVQVPSLQGAEPSTAV